MDPSLAIKGGLGWEIDCRRLRQVPAFQVLPATHATRGRILAGEYSSVSVCEEHNGAGLALTTVRRGGGLDLVGAPLRR